MAMRVFGVLMATFTILSLSLTAHNSWKEAVHGNIANVQGIALPDDLVITVIIEDVSMAVDPSNVCGVQIIHTDREQFPIPCEIGYHPGDIDKRLNFALSASFEDGSWKLLLISDTANPVITNGNPSEDVENIVVPVGWR